MLKYGRSKKKEVNYMKKLLKSVAIVAAVAAVGTGVGLMAG